MNMIKFNYFAFAWELRILASHCKGEWIWDALDSLELFVFDVGASGWISRKLCFESFLSRVRDHSAIAHGAPQVAHCLTY